MKRFSLINSKTLFFLIFSTIIIGLNLTPAMTQLRHTPAGRSFAFIHNNTQDFFFYQALMNEGARGDWLTTNPYTSEPHKPSVIFAYFLWLGKLSKLLNLSFALTYHLVRITLSIFLLFIVYRLLYILDLPYPRLAFIFFLFAAPMLHKINSSGKLITVPFMYWWTGIDPARRIAYLPHHMFGAVLLVSTLILIIKYVENSKKIKYIILSSCFTLPLAFVHPPSLFILLLVLPPASILYFITTSKFSLSFKLQSPSSKQAPNSKHQSASWRTSKRFEILNFGHLNLFGNWDLGFGIYRNIFIYWLIGLSVLLIMVSQTNQGFPWSQYIIWESKLQFPLNQELIGALGVLFPLSFIGAIKAIVSKRFPSILVVCWLFVPLILIPFSAVLNISNIRLIQGVPFLPLAILAVLGIEFLQTSLKAFFTRKSQIPNPNYQTNSNDQNSKSKTILSLKNLNLNIVWNLVLGAWNFKFIGLLVYWFIGLFFIIFTLPTLSWSLKNQIREYWPIYGNVYFDNRLFKAFTFINNHFLAKSITLSTFYTGNYLPAFTNTVSFIGHFGYTYNIEGKQKKVQQFFENKMSIQEAKEFVMNSKIDLIFQGPEEKPIYSSYLYPTVLKPVYDTEEVTLYTLK